MHVDVVGVDAFEDQGLNADVKHDQNLWQTWRPWRLRLNHVEKIMKEKAFESEAPSHIKYI